MSFLRFFLCMLILLHLSSCGTGGRAWSAKEKSKISTIAIQTGAIAPTAYKNPNASQNFTAAASTASILYSGNNGGDFGGGAAFGAAAVLVGQIGSKLQQVSFDSRYSASIPGLRRTVPTNLGQQIHRSVEAKLKQNSFIGPRLRLKSENSIQINVEKVQYLRVSKRKGEILIAPVIAGNFIVKKVGDRSPDKYSILGSGAAHANTATMFGSNPFLSRKAFEVAVENFSIEVANQISAKTGGGKIKTIERASGGKSKESTVVSSRIVNSANRNAVQLKSISQLLMTCSSPYRLTQGCNRLLGPARKVTVGGIKLRIGGSADGRIVVVHPGSMISLAETINQRRVNL